MLTIFYNISYGQTIYYNSYVNSGTFNWTSKACSTWLPAPDAASWYDCRSSGSICWHGHNMGTDNAARNHIRICNADTSSSSARRTFHILDTDTSAFARWSSFSSSCVAVDVAIMFVIGCLALSSRCCPILKPMSSCVNNRRYTPVNRNIMFYVRDKETILWNLETDLQVRIFIRYQINDRLYSHDQLINASQKFVIIKLFWLQ